MAFYLKPPRGIIAFHNLQKCVEERLRFFKEVDCAAVSVHSAEYLFEGSAFDRAGHFTLRLAAVKYFGFSDFFVKSEVNLLKLRLNAYDGCSVIDFLKTVLRHARECIVQDGNSDKVLTFLKIIVTVATKMISRSYRTHVFSEMHVHSDKCKIFTLNVPFQYCVSLVSKHQVNLKKGYAQILCVQWKDLLLSLFCSYLRMAITEMHYSKSVQKALEDDRINSILAYVNNQEGTADVSRLSGTQISVESRFFPLCMQHLHNVLKRSHRLAHEERFNLSLFLKDIGVSLEDSLTYWKTEYSKEHRDCSCSHSWQGDEKRYIYSIRHLYGLEGSRKTYKTRCCGYFQNVILKPMQEGGCPYKHFDNYKLTDLLSVHIDKNGDNLNRILRERSQNPLSACKLFLTVVNDVSECTDNDNCSSSDINFNNPVQYFLLMKHFKYKFAKCAVVCF